MARQDKHTHTHLRENTTNVLKSSKSITQLLQNNYKLGYKTNCDFETTVHSNYSMAGERVRFLFTSCGESQTNERVFERVSL